LFLDSLRAPVKEKTGHFNDFDGFYSFAGLLLLALPAPACQAADSWMRGRLR
jgi:hypothetical protein